jgi:ubiquinone/menaquinone biosynthesis C-methylase UbiE
MADPVFQKNLFRGTADSYDQFRLPYPEPLVDELARQTSGDGTGRLLDLACGTGQICFALRDRFAEIWAVDQEPDMTALVRQKAEQTGDAARFRILTSSAEELDAPAAAFDLVAMGNAFHRMQRDKVAANALRWLRPGGYLALLWGGGPSDGTAPWQRVLSELSERWRHHAGIMDRVPAGHEATREERPDAAILAEAGFEIAGSDEFSFSHDWTIDELTGHAFSTSVLSQDALGDLAPQFAADLRRTMLAAEPSGCFRQVSTFACELARRPALSDQ